MPLFGQRSRGLLGLDLLRCTSAARALEKAQMEFAKTRYEGCNLLIADAANGYAIYADERQEVVELVDGLNIIGARNLNDPEDQRVQIRSIDDRDAFACRGQCRRPTARRPGPSYGQSDFD